MEHESNIQKLDFAVLVPQAQRGDSRAVNSLLLGFTPMVRAFKYNSYYVHYLEQDDTEILALMAVNDAIKSFKQRNFHFFATHVKYTIRRQLNIQRLVISEVFLRGKSQREVAATLGVTSQSVYCSKKAALDTLRRAFGLRQEGLR